MQKEPDLDDIESKAKAATPGPYVRWSYEGDRDKKHRNSVCRHVVGIEGDDHACVAHTVNRFEEQSRADAEYLASLDPTTVLALLAECRELRRLRGALEFLHNNKRVRSRYSPESVYEIAASLGWKEGT